MWLAVSAARHSQRIRFECDLQFGIGSVFLSRNLPPASGSVMWSESKKRLVSEITCQSAEKIYTRLPSTHTRNVVYGRVYCNSRPVLPDNRTGWSRRMSRCESHA